MDMPPGCMDKGLELFELLWRGDDVGDDAGDEGNAEGEAGVRLAALAALLKTRDSVILITAVKFRGWSRRIGSEK